MWDVRLGCSYCGHSESGNVYDGACQIHEDITARGTNPFVPRRWWEYWRITYINDVVVKCVCPLCVARLEDVNDRIKQLMHGAREDML